MKYLAVALVLTICTILHAKAQVPDMNDSLAVAAWLKEKHIPALAVGYIENGKIKSICSYGELKAGVPISLSSIFNVASITKTITIMVTLNLVNSGKWKLDEPIARYWTDPDIKNDPRSQKLTTRDLLTHRSGFPNWRSQQASGKLAFQFDPGTKYQYSGEGFEYLRHALERKFNRKLEQLADSLIFSPLDMRDTRFTWNNNQESRFAYPFDANQKQLEPTHNTAANAADLLKTTVPDYCKFVLWVLNGGGLSKKLYTEMTSHQVTTKPGAYMGLGWAIYDPIGNSEYAISHGGHDPRVHTMAILLPQSKKRWLSSLTLIMGCSSIRPL
ncbi:beta-lactamase family protein [Mucilaginibacter sp. S1162]|uniref:Beta-lactamase family protein n=1 Tax=Mucilaginibacter humi TaxID=2732510 RepID=A0ABX1W3X7_9SPHI|nr:serine hydrolase domain-containing protein [Mucilaginibacter humi]NNU34873.1 beta-lactamase family protein [Mucilaginibacter humi]